MPENYKPRNDDPWEKYEEGLAADSDHEIKKSPKTIFYEPSFVLALATGVFYIFVFRYYSAFFSRLSIPFNSLDLPFTFYLSAGYKLLYIAVLISITILIIIILINIFDILYTITKHIHSPNYSLGFPILDFSETIVFLMGIFEGYYEAERKLKNRLLLIKEIIYLSIILLFIIAYIYTDIRGGLDAQDLMEGKADNTEIVFDLKNKSDCLTNVANKTLILVTYSKNNYYVVEKSAVAPKYARVHIIPDSKIDMATLKTIEEKSKFSSIILGVQQWISSQYQIFCRIFDRTEMWVRYSLVVRPVFR